MVYIFFVQPGDMKTFDNEISIMQSVGDLKEKIAERCNIHIDQQVLLINGGEPLDATKNLCSYMAGTDTNPIYLFSTNFEVSDLATLSNLNFDDSDLKQRLADCLNLQVSLTTVKTRALVAQDFHSIAKQQLEFCENMVHEQHLQQQGWSAVIANLEDIVVEFKNRWDSFLKMYEGFIADRETYEGFLCSFDEDKRVLRSIPVIETLLESQREQTQDSGVSDSISEATSETEHSKEISLYDWISSSNNKNSLDEIYELCKSNLNKFEKDVMPTLRTKVDETLRIAETPERKEIDGLSKRLFDLDELMRRIRADARQQSDMAQSFLQNQNSVAQLRDPSILPDLCTTHKQQLGLIRDCHERLMEDRNRIVKAKHELSKSLCTRITWVQSVENKLYELDSSLVYFNEHLQRLRKHLQVFQQLHLAPLIYMNSIVEVVRRRSFSQIFLMWASDLACQQLTIHNEEVTRRKEFSTQFDGHFINALFPGMGDLPPSFATEAPSMFDAKLPKIGEMDIERLKKELPDFAETLVLPDMTHVISVFMGRLSVSKNKEDKVDDASAVEERLMQAVSDVGLASNLDKNILKGSEPSLASASALPNLKDDKGCESETDTEEFEKVGQSPLELNFPQGVATGALPKATEKQDASTITEDNLQISRTEHETLKSLFNDMSRLANMATKNLRTGLNDLRQQVVSESRELRKQYEEFGITWETLLVEVDKNEKEIVESMTRQSDEARESYRYSIIEKDHVLRKMEEDKRAMEDRIRETCKRIATLEGILVQQNIESSNKITDLQKQLQEKDIEIEKKLKEARDKHKAELENTRSRLKLMEKSPSLTSLEKEKSGDFASLPGNSTLLMQMTDNFELDKEKAVSEERSRWEKILDDNLKQLEKKYTEEKNMLIQDVAKRVSEEKDKQIDILTEREKNLNLEVCKYKTTIQQLAEDQEDFALQMESLKKEKEDVLEQLRIAKEQLEIIECIKDKQGPPSLECSQQSSQLSKSEIVYSKQSFVKIVSCNVGDIVLVMWDQEYETFLILQQSKHKFFLDPGCLAELDLVVSNGKPNKPQCVGEVVAKELVKAAKADNHYKLPIGTKFYLVIVKPLSSTHSASQRSQVDTSNSSLVEGIANMNFIDQPEELLAESVNRQLTQDSGTDNVEQGQAATEESDRLEVETTLPTQVENNPLVLQKQEVSTFEKLEEFRKLKAEKLQLQLEVNKIKDEKEVLMSTSLAVCEGKQDATTSPPVDSPSMVDLSRSEIVSNRPHRLNIDTCKVGDIVLLLWDAVHENFRILQESKHMYFLHSDCLESLGLTITDGKPNKIHCTGEVINKEYCLTRKDDNRYKVPKGRKFYRVKVKPVSPLSSHSTRRSSSLPSSQSIVSTFDPLIEEGPSTSTTPVESVDKRNIEERGRHDSDTIRIEDIDQSVEVKLFEDSGIGEGAAAIDAKNRNVSDSCNEVIEQSTYVSTNWVEAMFRSMFSK